MRPAMTGPQVCHRLHAGAEACNVAAELQSGEEYSPETIGRYSMIPFQFGARNELRCHIFGGRSRAEQRASVSGASTLIIIQQWIDNTFKLPLPSAATNATSATADLNRRLGSSSFHAGRRTRPVRKGGPDSMKLSVFATKPLFFVLGFLIAHLRITD